MVGLEPLTIAYTPDSDDAFYYDAIQTGQIALPGYLPQFSTKPMRELNRAALQGAYDVSAISSVVYPQIADEYAILSVGASVGRGYGPVLVSKHPQTIRELADCRVGVPGIPTTGWFLLRCLCSEAIPVEMAHDEIAGAVARGDLAAGVMIHEELLHYPKVGLQRIVDLGADWCQRHELPLPVGLNVIRRDLGHTSMELICLAVRRSLEHGLRHLEETLARVKSSVPGIRDGCTEQFVSMFANSDSVRMPRDVRAALAVLFKQVADLGLSPAIPHIDIIEGMPSGKVLRSSRMK